MPHDVDAAHVPAAAGEVDEDRAAVDEGRLQRLAADLYHPAVAGEEPVAGEPRPAELDAPCDAFLLDDGPVVGGRGQLGDVGAVLVRDIVKCCGSGVWRDQAASFWTSCSVWQRSSSTPSMNGTPARTKGSRCAPFKRRHRRCAMSKSL